MYWNVLLTKGIVSAIHGGSSLLSERTVTKINGRRMIKPARTK